MAVRAAVRVRLTVIGDGSDTTYAALVATAPWFVADINPGWQAAQPLPTGVANPTSSDGQTISATLSMVNTLLTFTWPVAIPSGDSVDVYVTLLYA